MVLAQNKGSAEEEVDEGYDDDSTSPSPADVGDQGGDEEAKGSGKKKGGMLLAILKKIRSFLDIKKSERYTKTSSRIGASYYKK